MSHSSDLFGEGAVGRFAHRRSGQHRQPVALVPASAAAKMGELDHDLAVMLMTVFGDLLQPRHDRVIIGMQVAKAGGESWLTMAEPAVIVSAMPPFAFSR